MFNPQVPNLRDFLDFLGNKAVTFSRPRLFDSHCGLRIALGSHKLPILDILYTFTKIEIVILFILLIGVGMDP